MKKKTKYIITLLIGVISLIIGFCLYFFIPISSSSDNISSEEIDNAANLSTMLKITVDNLDIINESDEVITKAQIGDIYEVTDLDYIDSSIKYTIIYNDEKAFITIPKSKNKASVEIYNEEKQENKEPSQKVTITTNKNTLSIPAEKEYYCESGYTLNEDKCSKTITKDAVSKETIECAGDYNETYNICHVYTTYDFSDQASKYCTENNLTNRETCCKAIEGTYNTSASDWCTKKVRKSITPQKKITYSCEKGWKLNDTKCEQTTTISSKYKYVCPNNYTLANDICLKND